MNTRQDKIKNLMNYSGGEVFLYTDGIICEKLIPDKDLPEKHQSLIRQKTKKNLIINLINLGIGSSGSEAIQSDMDTEVINIINLGKGIKQ